MLFHEMSKEVFGMHLPAAFGCNEFTGQDSALLHDQLVAVVPPERTLSECEVKQKQIPHVPSSLLYNCPT